MIGATWAAKEAYDEYTKATSQWTIEEKALHREIKENAKALSEAKEARDENLAGIDAEYGYYDKLRDELDSIVDKNGKVKEGYKDRAKFITNTLSEKLGIEFKWNEDIIKSYQDIREEIKKTIKAKREEAKLNAYKEDYEKAVKTASDGTNSQDYKAYADAIEKRNKDEKRLKKAENELKKHGGDKGGALGTGTTDAEYARLKNVKAQAEKDLKKSENDVTTAWNTYTKNRDLIANYEKASAAVIEGHHKTATKTLTALSEEIILAGNATNETAGQQLLQQYQSAQRSYDELVKAYSNGEKGITRKMVKEAERRRNKAETELDIYRTNVGEKAAKTAESIGNAQSKVNSEDNLKKAKSRSKKVVDASIIGMNLDEEQDKQVKSNTKALFKKASSKEVKEYAKSKAGGLGNNFVSGFIASLLGGVGSAFKAGWDFVTGALWGAQKAQDSHSPSKKSGKLADDNADGYILNLKKKYKSSYKTGYDFVKNAINGARSAQTDFSLDAIVKTSASDVNYNALINHKIEPITKSMSKSSNTPKVSVSSPVVSIQFGDVTVNNADDIDVLAERLSETVGAVVVNERRSNGS